MLSQKKPANPFTERQYESPALPENLRQGKTPLNEQTAEAKQKLKIVDNKIADKNKYRKQALTRPEDLVNYNDVSVTRLLARRFNTPFNVENYRKSARELRLALISVTVLLAAVACGWLVISSTNFLADGNFAYNAGLLGGFLMLCSIFYALMKRVRFINALGKNDTWFYAHLVCGIVGPLLIIFHSSFQLKSVNSSVAFLCMLAVLLSGLFGRYVFPLISFKTQRVYQDVGDVELDLLSTLQDYRGSTNKPTKAALTQLIVNGLKKPNSWIHNVPQMLRMLVSATAYYRALAQDIKTICAATKTHRQWDKKTYKGNLADAKRMARSYVYRIVKLSMLSTTQNLFSNWRILHTSMLYILTITAVAHIVAIHMY